MTYGTVEWIRVIKAISLFVDFVTAALENISFLQRVGLPRFFLKVLGIKTRTLCMLNTSSATGLYPRCQICPSLSNRRETDLMGYLMMLDALKVSILSLLEILVSEYMLALVEGRMLL